MQPAPSPVPTVRMSTEQVWHYLHHGYLAIQSGVVPASELPGLCATYDRIFAERAGRADGRHFALFGDERSPERPMVHQILGPEQYAPEMTRTVAWANARAIFTAILGREPETMSGHAICKPPHSPLATPWHQDEAYWHPGHYHISASIWIPLQDVDEASGCMRFVPGSHLGEILPHRPAGDDPRAQGLELESGGHDLGNAVSCPLSAGGCTVHGGRMLHFTGPNQADIPRRAWIIMAGVPAPPRRIPAVRPWLDRMRLAREAAASEARGG